MTDEHTVIGIDLGGTKIAAARYSVSNWSLQEELRVDTNAEQGFQYVHEALAETVENLRTDSTKAVGVGVPGLVKQPGGEIHTLPNIPGAEGSVLGKTLYESTGLPCTVDNDANCFALAEASTDSCKDYRVVVAVTMGTGVGGGIVIDGKLFTGSQGFAGEIGHMLLCPGSPPYTTDDKRGDTGLLYTSHAADDA